jgi:segregation and condensation protein A
MQVACEADLSQSGQAFLSASMLVLFKANTLVELEQREAELEDLSEEDFPDANGVQAKLRLPLEHQLHRRPAALPPRKRRVTLQELIEQLQLMATQLQISQSAQALSTKTTRTGRLRTQAARATLELAHQENLTEVAGELEQFLNTNSHRILNQEQDWLNLDQLVELWTQIKRCTPMTSSAKHGNKVEAGELPPQPHDRVSVFWALLLLSAQSKVELSQEEFYQEIKIRTLEEE